MSPISPSSSFLLPINHRGNFFEDTFFNDGREDFHSAVRDVLSRGRDQKRTNGDRARDLSCYRKLPQQDDFDQDSQALTITEDENNRKILLDVKEFHPDGDVKVYALTDRQLLVEGHHQNPKTGRSISFTREFELPWYSDMSCGFFSVDISSDGVLRIVTTKKAPSTGRSIPLTLDFQETNQNESHQESYCNINNNSSNTNSSSNNNSNNRNVSFSMNGFKSGTVNNSEFVQCTSQQDTMREVPQNNKKEKIIPVVFVKRDTNKESNQNGSVQNSAKQNSSSSNLTNQSRPVRTVITTTFDVKSNSTEGIPAKQHEITIGSKTSGQRTDGREGTKQQQPHRNIPTSNGNSSSQKTLNKNEQKEDQSSQNSKAKRIIPIIVQKKKDKVKDADSTKGKTDKKNCFTILNKKTKADTSEKLKKEKTKDSKRSTHAEFIIPLTIEDDSLEEKPVQKEVSKRVEIRKNEQNKKNNGNKPPINQNKKAASPQPKKITISNIFTGQDENSHSNRSESASNKPPPSPNRKHGRSSSIEERLTMFTRMSPAAERKSRRDVMDEIRGNGRGARSRSSSIEELVLKFDKMSPQVERRVLNRKNSREENEEIVEKNQAVKRKESIIPIEIEGGLENYDSQNSYLNNFATVASDIASLTENLKRMEDNKNEENSNSCGIKSIVKRRDSIIPIKMEYEEDEDISLNAPISEGSSSVCLTAKENNNAQSLSNKQLDAETKDKINNGNIDAVEPINNSITKDDSDVFSSPCISYDSASDRNPKVNNDDDKHSSISSCPINEDDNSTVSADEESKNNSKGKTKKSSKSKVKRKQSIPGVQVNDDDTGETTVLLSKRSSSDTEKKKKNEKNTCASMGDPDDHFKSPQYLDMETEIYNKTKGTADSLTGFSNVNNSDSRESSDNFVKDISSNIAEISNTNLSSEKSDTEDNETKNCIGTSNEKMESRRSSILPSPSDLIKIKPPKKNKKENSGNNENSKNDKIESNNNGRTEQNTTDLKQSRRSSVLPSPSDLIKIKPPKKNKKEKSEDNEASKNDEKESINNEKTEQISIDSKQSRRSSVLPNPSDLLKIKPPKKNKKEKSEDNVASKNDENELINNEKTEQNSIDLKQSRRSSVLPNPSDLLKIKSPKECDTVSNIISKKPDTPDNIERSKISQDSQPQKDNPSEPVQPQNQTDSQQTQTSKNTHDLVTKDNTNIHKENDTKVLESIPENTLNPNAINNSDNNTNTLEPPPSPSLRRKTSFKKYKVFENKRTPSPSPIRRPADSLTPTKPEQFLINKIEDNGNSKKEETNNKNEETSSTKKEAQSSLKNSKTNACVNIENKDMFFSDPSFKDHRQLFMGGIREALKKSGITSMKDKLRVYRNLRLKGQTEDNQAICSAEDETSYKAVLDMTEFLEGEIKVKAISSTEIIIEATSDKSTSFTHSLPFPDSINMFAIEAHLSEDGILAINAPKTNPDPEI